MSDSYDTYDTYDTYEQRLKIVAAGGDPAGTAFDETSACVRSEAGNFLIGKSA